MKRPELVDMAIYIASLSDITKAKVTLFNQRDNHE